MPEKHYPFGGSTIHRTFGCPGWRHLTDKLPHNDRGSDAARLGTALHAAMENYLTDGSKAHAGDTLEGVTLTPEHIIEKFKPAVKALDELMDMYQIGDYIPEHRANISDDTGGSMDLVATGPNHTVVLDFKFGDGYLVDAEHNKQLLFYAAMAAMDDETADMFNDDSKKLVLIILQPTPRAEHVYTIWETDMVTLDNFIDEMHRALELARKQNDDNLITAAGSWCTFCPAMAICPTKTGIVQQAQRIDTTNPELIPILNEAMNMADQMETWIKAVRKLAYEQAQEGVSFEDYKLVDKRATRKWLDADGIKSVVSKTSKLKVAECYPQVLLSPAQMEKHCKQIGVDFKKFEGYISSVSTGTTLAKSTDKRPEALPVKALAALADRLA